MVWLPPRLLVWSHEKAWHSCWTKQVNSSLVSFDEWFLSSSPPPTKHKISLFKVWACGLTIVFWISRRMAAIWLQSCRVWTLEFLGSWTLENAFLLLGLGRTALGLCVQSPGAAGFRTLKSWRCLWCLLPWMWDVRLGCLLSFLSFPPWVFIEIFSLKLKLHQDACLFSWIFFSDLICILKHRPGFCLTWEHFPLTLNIIISLTFISSHSCTKHTFLPSLLLLPCMPSLPFLPFSWG